MQQRRAPPQLRLPGLAPRDLTAGAHPQADAESPVDVRALAASPSPHAGAGRKLELPPLAPLSQNEIKKAQNRKSAKRFREAQKRRWQQLNEELERHKVLVSDLKAALTSASSNLQVHTHVHGVGIGNGIGNTGGGGGPNGDRMSIGALTAPNDSAALADAEASLYAQLLCSAAPATAGPPTRPYVGELGQLHRCVVASRDGRVRATMRGAPLPPDAHLIRDVSSLDTESVRNALACFEVMAVGYVRGGTRFNAVVKPVPNSDDVLLAEFVPFVSATATAAAPTSRT